ncbi:hypothetical protein [Fundicoccus ignavus]|nr:hypothetical protein [Fundicoccus ignavus]
MENSSTIISIKLRIMSQFQKLEHDWNRVVFQFEEVEHDYFK